MIAAIDTVTEEDYVLQLRRALSAEKFRNPQTDISTAKSIINYLGFPARHLIVSPGVEALLEQANKATN